MLLCNDVASACQLGDYDYTAAVLFTAYAVLCSESILGIHSLVCTCWKDTLFYLHQHARKSLLVSARRLYCSIMATQPPPLLLCYTLMMTLWPPSMEQAALSCAVTLSNGSFILSDLRRVA